MIMSGVKSSKGFTIIEALIAFVVLTVGILGTLLFHSQLLSTSSDNKIRLEAIQVAEKVIEQARSDLAKTTTVSFEASVAALSYGPFVGRLNTYTVSFGSIASVGSGSPPAYSLPVTVNWPVDSGTDSVSLLTYLGFSDLTAVTNSDDVGAGSGADTYEGDIPLPTGTMTSVERVLLTDNFEDLDVITDNSRGSVVVYRETIDGEEVISVGVQIDENNVVRVGEFDSEDNEVFAITGRIYNDPRNPFYKYTNSKTVSFGNVFGYGASETLPSGYEYQVVEINGETFSFKKDIIDIEATEGANCVIGRFANAVALGAPRFGNDNDYFDVDPRLGDSSKQDHADDAPFYADYICIAGSGWNGTLNPYIRSYSDDDTELDITLGSVAGVVCSPLNRSYRYYLVDSDNLDGLLTQSDPTTWSNGTVLTGPGGIFETTSTSVKGQSGLVRFTSAAIGSGEKVSWNSYIWHNPNYIISPFETDSTLSITPSVAGPTGITAGSYESGYKGPQVVSTGSASYELMLPGDVTHQNFYIADDAVDCTSIDIPNMVDLADEYPSGTPAAFLRPGHYVSVEADNSSDNFFPGGIISTQGYVPLNSKSLYAEADYNTDIGSGTKQGVIVLGYSLVTERLSGSVTFDNTAASAGVSAFVIGGVDQDPTISITCTALDSTLEVIGDVSTFEFYCSVPNNWDGEVYAYSNSTDQEACERGTLSQFGSFDFVLAKEQSSVAAASTWDEISTASPSITLYYAAYLGEDVASGATAVAAQDFDRLAFYQLTTDRVGLVANDTDEDFTFYFKAAGGCGG